MPDRIRLIHLEDSQDYRQLIAAALNTEPSVRFVLVSVATLDEAVGMLKEHVFDCILLDWYLETTDGVANIRALREVEPDIPIVVFTSDDSSETMQRAREAGADAFLSKGHFDLPNMIQTLHFAASHRPKKDERVIAAFGQMLNMVESATESIERNIRSSDESDG